MVTAVITRPTGTQLFIPELVYFEPDALEYPKGQRIHAWAIQQNLPIHITTLRLFITEQIFEKFPQASIDYFT